MRATQSDIVTAAEWVATHIRSSGGSAELVPWGARPLVIGEVAASERPESAPTVLCYAHFDVQPPDPLDLWVTGPFDLTHATARLYARGIADDKGNMFVLVEAVRQLAEEGALPVNVRFAFDGEEEVGGDSIVEWVDADTGPADVALILDGGHDPPRPAGVHGRRSRDGLPARPRAHGRDGHALGHVRRGRPERHARADRRARSRSCPMRRAGCRAAPRRGRAASAEELAGVGAAAVGAEQLATRAPRRSSRAPSDFYLRTFADTALDVNGSRAARPTS
jgi:hypothetical protein